MQTLQDKWKSYRANRRLQSFWLDYTNSQSDNEKISRLSAFLECFNQIATDQMAGTFRPRGSVVVNVFQDVPLLINGITDVLDSSGFVSETLVQSIGIILKDYEEPQGQEIVRVLVKSMIINLSTIKTAEMLKRVLALVSDYSVSNPDKKSELAQCRGYNQLIEMLGTTIEFKDIIVRFFKQQFARPDLPQLEENKNEGRQSMKKGHSDVKSIFNAIKNDLAEYFTNPDYIFHEKAFEDQSPNNSLLDMGEAARASQGFRKPTLDEEDLIFGNRASSLHKIRHSEGPHRLSFNNPSDAMIKHDLDSQPHKNILEGLMLNHEFSSANRPSAVSQRSSKIESLSEYDQLSLLLREHQFMNFFIEHMNRSNSILAINAFLEILLVLITYSAYNDRDFERNKGYRTLQSIILELKDQQSENQVEKLFMTLRSLICPHTQQITNFNALKLLLTVIEQSNECTQVSVKAIQLLRSILESEIENCVIFHKANGYKYLENAITVIGTLQKNGQIPRLQLILETMQYVIYEVNDLDLLPMVEFLTEFISIERQSLTPEFLEETFSFINSIVDDKLRRAETSIDYDLTSTLKSMKSVFEHTWQLLISSIENISFKEKKHQTLFDNYCFESHVKLLLKVLRYQTLLVNKLREEDFKNLESLSDDSSLLLLPQYLAKDIDSMIQYLLSIHHGLKDKLKTLHLVQLIAMLIHVYQLHSIERTSYLVLSLLTQLSTEDYYHVFLSFLFNPQVNKHIRQLQVRLGSKLIPRLMENMNVGSLHLIALVVRDVESNQELVEQMTDIIIIAKVEEENHEMQAMILNFALEISGAKAIYTNRINDSELFIEHFMDQVLSHQYQEFELDMSRELHTLSKKFQRTSTVTQSYPSPKSNLILHHQSLLRYNSKWLTLFFIWLIQCKTTVQIKLFEDLTVLCGTDLVMQGQIIINNRKILRTACLEILIRAYLIAKEQSSSSEAQAYQKSLSDLIKTVIVDEISGVDPNLLLESLLMKQSIVNVYHLQNISSILEDQVPTEYFQIMPNEQIKDANIVLHTSQDKQLILNFWLKLDKIKPGQNTVLSLRTQKNYLKFVYEHIPPRPSLTQETNEVATPDYLIILVNDFYRKIPIDSFEDPHMLFRPAMYNNFHLQVHLEDNQSSIQPLLVLNGVNITDLVRSKLRFECGPIQLFVANRSQKIANFSMFESELSEKEAYLIFNRGLMTDGDIMRRDQQKTTEDILALKFEDDGTRNEEAIQIMLPFHKEEMRLQVILKSQPSDRIRKGQLNGTTDGFYCNITPLSAFLTSKEAFECAIELIEKAYDNKQLQATMTFFSLLFIHNTPRSTSLFKDMHGFTTLDATLQRKNSEGFSMNLAISSLFDICCNTLHVMALLTPPKGPASQQKRIRLSPRLDQSRLDFLEAGFKLLPSIAKEPQCFVDGLYAILDHSDFNKAVFEEGLGVATMLKLLQLLTSDSKYMAIYDKSVQIYELFIEGFTNDVVKNAVQDLQLIMDFIINLNYSSIKATKLGLDCLSVIALHLVVKQDHRLMQKFNQIDICEMIIMLFSVENTDINEYACRLFSLFMLKNAEFKLRFIDLNGYSMMNNIFNSKQALPKSLIRTLIDASTNAFDNPNVFYPSTSSSVHQLMNDSKIASQIVSQINATLHRPKKVVIQDFELYQVIFTALASVDSDQSRASLLKEIDVLIKSQSQDSYLNVINLHACCFKQFLDYIFEFLALVDFKIEQLASQLNFSENQNSATEESTSKHSSSFESPPQIGQIKSIEAAVDMITTIVIYDLQLDTKESKVYDYLESQFDEFKKLLIINQIIKYFETNPKIQTKDPCLLKNLKKIISTLDSLADDNIYLKIKSMQLINSLAFKNTMDLRKTMKQLQMFEIRDELMISIILNSSCVLLNQLDNSPLENLHLVQSKSQSEVLLKTISAFSYETVASKPKFRESGCIESIALFMLKSHLARDRFKSIIQDEIMQYEENNKYIKENIKELQSEIKDISQESNSGLSQMIEQRIKVVYQFMYKRRSEEKTTESMVKQRVKDESQTLDFHNKEEVFQARVSEYRQQMKKRLAEAGVVWSGQMVNTSNGFQFF